MFDGTVVVGLIVAAALGYIVYTYVFKKSGGCGCGANAKNASGKCCGGGSSSPSCGCGE